MFGQVLKPLSPVSIKIIVCKVCYNMYNMNLQYRNNWTWFKPYIKMMHMWQFIGTMYLNNITCNILIFNYVGRSTKKVY